ncbi:hypothetical protein CVT24_002448, partial [Panaeolus cyanescens]
AKQPTSRISAGVIAGSSLSAVAFLLFAGLAFFLFMRKKRAQRAREAEAPDDLKPKVVILPGDGDLSRVPSLDYDMKEKYGA